MEVTLFLLLFCMLQLISCSKKRYAYLDLVQSLFYNKESTNDSNASNSNSIYLTDTLRPISYDKIGFTVLSYYLFVKSSQFSLDFSNNAMAFSYRHNYQLQNNFTDIQFVLLTDYNAQFKAGDDAFDLLEIRGITSKQMILDKLNSDLSYNYDFNNILDASLKQAPSDTTLLGIQVILKDDNGTYFDDKSEIIKVY